MIGMTEEIKKIVNEEFNKAVENIKRDIENELKTAVEKSMVYVKSARVNEEAMGIIGNFKDFIMNGGFSVRGWFDNRSDADYFVNLFDQYSLYMDDMARSILSSYKVKPNHRINVIILVWQEQIKDEDTSTSGDNR